jgi:inward rectifier potassium channel
VIFSNKAIITDFDGIPTLMFRVANGRETNIANASIKVIALKPHTTKEGMEMRRYFPLELVSDFAPLFTITWTVMHPITKDSPLYGLSIDDILKDDISLILSFTGVDDVMAQSTHVNHHYNSKEIVKATKFEDIISVEGDTRIINLDNFNNIIE